MLLSNNPQEWLTKALKANIQKGIFEILNTVGQAFLIIRKSDGKAKRNARFFIQLVLHTMRLSILTQSMDGNCFKPGSELRLLLQ